MLSPKRVAAGRIQPNRHAFTPRPLAVNDASGDSTGASQHQLDTFLVSPFLSVAEFFLPFGVAVGVGGEPCAQPGLFRYLTVDLT